MKLVDTFFLVLVGYNLQGLRRIKALYMLDEISDNVRMCSQYSLVD